VQQLSCMYGAGVRACVYVSMRACVVLCVRNMRARICIHAIQVSWSDYASMYVYMCMFCAHVLMLFACASGYVSVSVSTLVYEYLYVHAYVYAYVCVSVCVCVCVCICAYAYAYAYVYFHLHLYLCAYRCVGVYMQ
jgi:hypothetical protein